MMGSGKTAIGHALANHLRVTHIDSDEEIVKAANMSISEIFERDGEDFFRRRETAVLKRILIGKPKVVSTGGGAFTSFINRKIISSRGISVWLKADANLLWSRVKNNKSRPLLKKPNPFLVLKQLTEERNQFYSMANLCIVIKEEYKILDSVQRLLNELKKMNN
jgi:shikimate kinase